MSNLTSTIKAFQTRQDIRTNPNTKKLYDIDCQTIRQSIEKYKSEKGKELLIALFSDLINSHSNGLISDKYLALIDTFNKAKPVTKLPLLMSLIDTLCSDHTHGGTNFIRTLYEILKTQEGGSYSNKYPRKNKQRKTKKCISQAKRKTNKNK